MLSGLTPTIRRVIGVAGVLVLGLTHRGPMLQSGE